MHIVVADDLPRSAIALLEAEGWSVDARTGRSPEQLAVDLREADALIVRSATRVTAALVDAGVRLRVIARAGAGVDTIDLEATRRRGIPVVNAPAATTTSVAELTVALLLALARHVSAADRSMKSGQWEKKAFAGTELAGKTLGVLGFGRIGRRVAAVARTLAMHVVVHDPAVSIADAAAEGVTWRTADEVCAEADYLTIHMPGGAARRHFLNASRLAACRRGVRIVNTSRGEIIDESALFAALESGHVAGAGLDVFEKEPPPADSALVRHPRVVASPHVGASTAEAQERVGLETAGAVRDYLKHGTLTNAVP